jgi:hypothetical protein
VSAVRNTARASALSRPQQDLSDLLDRTLGAGVVLAGDVTLSLADVELVYLNLRALLASVATLESRGIPFPRHGGRGVESGPGPLPVPPGAAARAAPVSDTSQRSVRGSAKTVTNDPQDVADVSAGAARDGDRLERGLAQLVLTVVELLRKLMERQALRRVEAGTLSPGQVERLGLAFERLEAQIAELKERLDFDDDDLTLRLGPLTGFDLPHDG